MAEQNPGGSTALPAAVKSPDRTDPYAAFRFKVKAGGFGYLDIGGTDVGKFAQCSGIKASVNMVRVRTGADIRGVQGIVPTTVEYSNVVFSKGVISSNAFLNWVFDAMPGYAMGPTKLTMMNRRTIDIAVLDGKGKEGVTWTLYGAYPVSYELASLDASQDGVLMESLEFAYVGLKRSK